MLDVDVAFAGVASQADLVRRGEVSSRELVELALRRIAALDPDLRVIANRLRGEVGEVVALGIKRSRTARKVGDGHRGAEQDPTRRRTDKIEDVAAVAMQSTHRVDKVRTLEALYGRRMIHRDECIRSAGPLVWLIGVLAGSGGRPARPGG